MSLDASGRFATQTRMVRVRRSSVTATLLMSGASASSRPASRYTAECSRGFAEPTCETTPADEASTTTKKTMRTSPTGA